MNRRVFYKVKVIVLNRHEKLSSNFIESGAIREFVRRDIKFTDFDPENLYD